MQSNLPYLFDPSQFQPRKTVLQREFEKKNRDFLISFNGIAYEAYDKTIRLLSSAFQPNEMDKNQYPVTMCSFLKQAMIRNYPELCWKATPMRFKLALKGDTVYIKKLNSDRKPSNIETKENDLILCQRTKDAQDNGGIVFLGYTTTDDHARITGVYAVCIHEEEIKWITDLGMQGAGEQGIVVSNAPTGDSPVNGLKDGVVRKPNEKME